jgi:DDE domain
MQALTRGVVQHQPLPVLSGLYARYYRGSLLHRLSKDGNVLDMLVKARRDKAAAKTFFRRLLEGFPDAAGFMINDQLRSYRAAKCGSAPGRRARRDSCVGRGSFTALDVT